MSMFTVYCVSECEQPHPFT